MKRTGSMFPLGSEFDDFLLAPIGDDNNGMLLSVLSALARLDVDPWEEAAELARLPGDAATRKLAALIAALPAGPSARPDSATIAARLIPLLPRQVDREVASRPTSPSVATITHPPILTYLIVNFICLLFMLAYRWLVASPPPQSPLNSTTALPAHIVAPQSPSPRSLP
jgi:hypothetical protein